MPPICKTTIFIFYLSIIQFTAALAVMTGEKRLESPKSTQISPVVMTSESEDSVPNATRGMRKIVTVQAYTVHKDLCGVNDSSNNRSKRKAVNCSTTSSSVTSKAKHCGLNSRLVGESCLCNEGYKQFPFSDVCVKTQGQPCIFQQNDCYTDMTSMACINNVCSCEDSDIYDHITLRCDGRVGGLCYPGIKDCVLNAHCVNVPSTAKRAIRKKRDPSFASSSSSSGYYNYYQTDQIAQEDYIISSNSDIELSGRCQCKEGFVETQGGLCRKTYGGTCTYGGECDSLNLVCKEGRCLCSDALQVYDLVSKSCVALVGAKCSDESGGTGCVKFGYCQKINQKVEGKCACVEDAVETEMRTCSREESTASSSFPISSLLRANNEQGPNRILFNDY